MHFHKYKDRSPMSISGDGHRILDAGGHARHEAKGERGELHR
jgi:hypothetical protein